MRANSALKSEGKHLLQVRTTNGRLDATNGYWLSKPVIEHGAGPMESANLARYSLLAARMRGISPGATVITSCQSGCFSYCART
jgi:hypothetical protein